MPERRVDCGGGSLDHYASEFQVTTRANLAVGQRFSSIHASAGTRQFRDWPVPD